eukprot:1161233-Pelagomonas_calceolata.AAC.13
MLANVLRCLAVLGRQDLPPSLGWQSVCACIVPIPGIALQVTHETLANMLWSLAVLGHQDLPLMGASFAWVRQRWQEQQRREAGAPTGFADCSIQLNLIPSFTPGGPLRMSLGGMSCGPLGGAAHLLWEAWHIALGHLKAVHA